MPPHLFKYRSGQGIPAGLRVNDDLIPSFGHRHNEKTYRVIEDSEVVEAILEYDANRDGPSLFRHLSPDELEETLESAKEAIAAIEAGEVDDILDFLLYAERAHDERTTVLEAIVSRSAVVERQQQDDDGTPTVDAGSLTTSR